ncbi:response regulator [Desulfonatronum thiosulfatophilum]|nr:response regulator [Desulfonatronum thiosulfatophilum]
MYNAKILVIDDEYYIRLFYFEELQDAGYDVATSDGSKDIIDLLQQEKPDVVILDIKLEGNRSGFDLLREIRRHGYELPVILCSSRDEFQRDLQSLAADHFVCKSIDLTELKEKIELVLYKSGHPRFQSGEKCCLA